MSSDSLQIQYYKSPVGELVIGDYGGRLCLCDWRYRKQREQIDKRIHSHLNTKDFIEEKTVLIENTIHQLKEYFQQSRTVFDIPMLLCGSDFQKSVWEALLAIPYGETTNYAALSEQMGNLKAIRAVASANGANALSIIIPCHRVIGADGKLVGYVGGLKAKEYLLKLEGAEQQQLSIW